MANTAVDGRVVDSSGTALSDVTIVAYDVILFGMERELGRTTPTANGHFGITYSPNAYWIEQRPDIRVRVFDPVWRLVYESAPYINVTTDRLDVGLITIPIADAQGWLVTLRTGTPTLLTQGNSFALLVDNEQVFRTLTQAVQAATTSINSMQLYFDVDNTITVFTPSVPQVGVPVSGERLEEHLLAVNRQRGVSVHLLVNDFFVLPYPIDTADRVVNYFQAASLGNPHTIKVRRFRRPYNTPMHAKLTVFDSKVAIINCSPILQEYFDGTAHAIDDPRRGAMSGLKNSIRVPVHDVGMVLEGPCVEHMDRTFALNWERSGGSSLGPASYPQPQQDNVAIQVVRTLPGNLFPSIPNGEAGILEAYQRAVRNANDFI